MEATKMDAFKELVTTMTYRNIVSGEVVEIEWTTDHAASSYGRPVPVIAGTGEAVDLVFYERLDGEQDSCESREK